MDKNLNEPIPYVTVAIKNAAGEIITGAATDENGRFQIKDLPDGKLTVSIQYIGYKTYQTEVTIQRGNRNLDLGNVNLEEDPQEDIPYYPYMNGQFVF